MPRVWGRGLMFGLDSDIGGSALRLWVAAGSAALLVFVCALAIRLDADPHRGARQRRDRRRAARRDLGLDLSQRRERSRSGRRAARARDPRGGIECPGAGAGFAARLSRRACRRQCRDRLRAGAVRHTGDGRHRNDLCGGAARAFGRHHGLYQTRRRQYRRRLAAAPPRAADPTASALSRIRWWRATAAPATIARRWRCCRIRAGCAPISSGDTLGHYLDHYITAWAQSPGVPVADGAPPMGPVAAQTTDGAAPPRKSALNVDFPSADSIPAISIMNPEPKGGTPTPAAAAAAVAAGQQSSAKVAGQMQMPPMPPMPGVPTVTASQGKDAASGKGKRKQAANPPAQTAAAPPAAPPEPVWNPGATLASPQPAASAASSAPPPSAAPAHSSSSGVPLAGMPVQLNPFTSPQGQ